MLNGMQVRNWAIWYTDTAPAGAPPSVSAHEVERGSFDGHGRLLVWLWHRAGETRPVWEVRAEHVRAYREYDSPVAAHVATFSDPPTDAVLPPEPLDG